MNRRSVLVGGFALWVAACGSEDVGPRNEPVAIGGASGTERAAVQILRRGNGAEPQGLDPHRVEGVPASNILRDLYEGLVSEAPDGSLIPGVAESWAVSDDGLIYTFRIRPDARWSNGDPVTARDFEFGLQRTVDPATLSRYSSILFPIVNAEAIANGELPPDQLGVVAIDDAILEITLQAPTPYLLGLLTHSTTYPVHRASLEEHGERFARPGTLVSNGAYQLTDWVVQSHIKVERNPEYWDDANTTIDEVWYYPIENYDAELKRYRADEIDITDNVPINQLDWIRENLGDELEIAPYFGSYYYGLNLTAPPFKDQPKLRTALAMAIDRDIITGKVAGSGEIPAYGWVPPVPGYEGQQPDWAGWTQEQRNEAARRLYAEAGFSDERPLKVELLYNTNENHKRIAVAIAAMWKQTLGVETSLLNQEWKVFLDTRANMDTEIFRAGWIGDYNDAYSFAQLMHSTNEQNDSGYFNTVYDDLLDRAAGEPDPQARAELMQQAEAQLLADLPIIPIYFYVSKHLVKPWVGGYEGNIMDRHYSKNLYILAH
ncbi:MAG: peptide ABC transporter substrate-binding protein [Gammaproteobacteria bacterium]|nr:peptide ABC transporter substrate-binding protein [Gammaproteobacteria bacterium]